MNSNHTKFNNLLGLAAVATLCVACASGPTRVEEDFGNSVRAMRQAQTLDPVAAAAPDLTPVAGTDGQRMENALNTYRTGVGDPAAVSESIEFDIGN